jgi:capsular polysaccharide biosynthesis protein
VGGFDLRNTQLNGKGHAFSTEPITSLGETYGRTYENEQAIAQTDLVRVIRRRVWIIVLVALVFGGLAAGFSFAQTPTYETSVLVLIGQKQAGKDVPTSLQSNVQGLQQITQTVATAATTDPIVDGVVQKLNLDSPTLPGTLSAEVITDTTFVQMFYKDTDPERAQRIVDAAGEVLSERISEVSPGTGSVTATVWQSATLPEAPVSPDPVRNILLGLLLGVMVGVGLAFLLDYLDDDWSSLEEVEKVSGVATLGVIPAFKIPKTRKEEGTR